MPDIGPAPILALFIGAFHTCLYVLVRGSAGTRLPFVMLAAVLGAYAGQAIAARLGDPLRIGDFGLLWASGVSWLTGCYATDVLRDGAGQPAGIVIADRSGRHSRAQQTSRANWVDKPRRRTWPS